MYYQRLYGGATSRQRKTSPQIETVMKRYRIDPYEDDDMYSNSYAPKFPQFTRDTYLPMAPQIISASYRYVPPSKKFTGRYSRYEVKSDLVENKSSLASEVDNFLDDMDERRRVRAAANSTFHPNRPAFSSKPTLGSTYKSIYKPTTGYSTQRKWSKDGEMFAEDVRKALNRVRIDLSSDALRKDHTGHSSRMKPECLRNENCAPLLTSTREESTKKLYTYLYRDYDPEHRSPLASPNTSHSDGPGTNSRKANGRRTEYVQCKETKVDKPLNIEKPVRDEGIFHDEHPATERDTGQASQIDGPLKTMKEPTEYELQLLEQLAAPPDVEQADGLMMWEDIDLDDIVEDLTDDLDEWRKDKMTCVEEPGYFAGHGFRSEPVKMSAAEGHIIWAKPRGELDLIISYKNSTQDFICRMQAEPQGVRVSQLMAAGDEEVIMTGRDDLGLHEVASHQGHAVLMLEALCTPYLKKVFKMNYTLQLLSTQ